MKKGLQFIFLVSIFIYMGCSSTSKMIRQKKSTSIINEPNDSLYPSSDVVVPYHTEWTKGHYPEMINQFKKHPLATGDIVFIGNSLTELAGDWGSRLHMATIKNRGIAGDVSYGVLLRLKEICFYKPTAVFILIGINDMWNDSLSAAYIAGNIIKIAATIHRESHDTKLYVQTILPTTYQKLIAKIKEVNDKLKSQATPKTYSLIDLHSFFANENDIIKNELTSDGVHLTEEGYSLWVSVLSKYLK